MEEQKWVIGSRRWTMETLTLFSAYRLPRHLVNTVTVQALPGFYGTCHPEKTPFLELFPLYQFIPPRRHASGLLRLKCSFYSCLRWILADMHSARLLFNTHFSHSSLSSAIYLGGGDLLVNNWVLILYFHCVHRIYKCGKVGNSI